MISAEETDQQVAHLRIQCSQNHLLGCSKMIYLSNLYVNQHSVSDFSKVQTWTCSLGTEEKTNSGGEQTDADKMMSSMGSHHEDSACKNSPAMQITASDSNDAERNKTGGNEPIRFMDDWTSRVSWTWFRYGRQSRHRYLKANAVWHQGSQKEPIIFKLSLAPLDR